MRLTPVAIIADDLTGAADTAAVFARPDLSVPVSLRMQPPIHPSLTAFAVTTESRGCCPAVAGDKMAEAIRLLEHTDHGLAYKKVDSNMRGNVGAELERIWQIQQRATLLCPAFPQRNRTVIDGRVFVELTPLADTELAQDPQSPVKHSCVADIVREQASRLHVGLLSLQELRHDATGLEKLLEVNQVVVSDAETDGDLTQLARAALSLPQPPVFCGSAGLAAALAQLIIVDHRESRPPRELGERIGEVDGDNLGPVLAVLASSSNALERQVRFAERRLGVEPIRFECGDLSWDEEEVPELTKAIDGAVSRLRSGRPAVVQAVGPLPSASRPVDLIVEHLAHLAFVAVKQGSPRGLLVGGGATAHAVLSTLGAAEIEVEEELLPGIAMGRTVGGHFGDRPVALKPGAAGGDDALVHILRCLSACAEARKSTAGEDR